jgi:hypothetical protein
LCGRYATRFLRHLSQTVIKIGDGIGSATVSKIPFGFGAERWNAGVCEFDSLGAMIFSEVKWFWRGFIRHEGERQEALFAPAWQ